MWRKDAQHDTFEADTLGIQYTQVVSARNARPAAAPPLENDARCRATPTRRPTADYYSGLVSGRRAATAPSTRRGNMVGATLHSQRSRREPKPRSR